MKNLHIWFAILLMSLLVPSGFAQLDPKTLQIPDMEFKPIRPSVVSLKKGIEFYFVESHETPVVQVNIVIKTGSLYDPPGKEGLTSLALRLMKHGGTNTLTPENVEEKLDFLGSRISVSSQGEYSVLSLWTLARNFEESWKIVAALLLQPVFAPDRLELLKKQALGNIRRRWERPITIGFWLFDELLFGKEFPEVRRTTTASIESISREEILAFYQNNIRHKDLIVAFTGDFNANEMTKRLQDTFQDWQVNTAEEIQFPKARLMAKPGIYLIHKNDLTQAVICMGHWGIYRHDPDNVAISVFNAIYGKRVNEEIRAKRGLAYSVFGTVGAGRDVGTYVNFCQTKSSSVGEAILGFKEVVDDLTKNPVPLTELTMAHKQELNSFVHLFNAPTAVVQQWITLRLQGYPDNYLETYIAKTQAVDQNKMLQIAQRVIRPSELVILVVGKKEDVLPQLQALNMGAVTELPMPKE